jgi:NADPH-dependent curcumin reductase CurA
MATTNRQLLLQARPSGLCAPGDLQLSESPVAGLHDGQALARVRLLSIDPTMRVWMADRDSYLPKIPLGSVMRAFGLAEIVESRSSDFRQGDKVIGLVGLQDYVTISSADARHFQKIPSLPFVSDGAFLGVLGVTGLTAYFGMTDIAKPQHGETLVVSAAAGATGSIAGQIGKIHGCRVVGIAGSDEKCKWLVDDLGFDAAINYKQVDWKEKLAAATPRGIDIDFENVGGEVMHAVLGRMNMHGRVVLCGLISSYAKEDPALGSFSTIIVKRLRVEGFIIIDYAAKFMDGAAQLGKWKMLGKIKDRETMLEGLERVPEAINMLFKGENTGKLLVRVS